MTEVVKYLLPAIHGWWLAGIVTILRCVSFDSSVGAWVRLRASACAPFAAFAGPWAPQVLMSLLNLDIEEEE